MQHIENVQMFWQTQRLGGHELMLKGDRVTWHTENAHKHAGIFLEYGTQFKRIKTFEEDHTCKSVEFEG